MWIFNNGLVFFRKRYTMVADFISEVQPDCVSEATYKVSLLIHRFFTLFSEFLRKDSIFSESEIVHFYPLFLGYCLIASLFLDGRISHQIKIIIYLYSLIHKNLLLDKYHTLKLELISVTISNQNSSADFWIKIAANTLNSDTFVLWSIEIVWH